MRLLRERPPVLLHLANCAHVPLVFWATLQAQHQLVRIFLRCCSSRLCRELSAQLHLATILTLHFIEVSLQLALPTPRGERVGAGEVAVRLLPLTPFALQLVLQYLWKS